MTARTAFRLRAPSLRSPRGGRPLPCSGAVVQKVSDDTRGVTERTPQGQSSRDCSTPRNEKPLSAPADKWVNDVCCAPAGSAPRQGEWARPAHSCTDQPPNMLRQRGKRPVFTKRMRLHETLTHGLPSTRAESNDGGTRSVLLTLEPSFSGGGRKENGIREGEASAVCEIVMALVINEL